MLSVTLTIKLMKALLAGGSWRSMESVNICNHNWARLRLYVWYIRKCINISIAKTARSLILIEIAESIYLPVMCGNTSVKAQNRHLCSCCHLCYGFKEMREAGHVARMEVITSVFKIWIGKTWGIWKGLKLKLEVFEAIH